LKFAAENYTQKNTNREIKRKREMKKKNELSKVQIILSFFVAVFFCKSSIHFQVNCENNSF